MALKILEIAASVGVPALHLQTLQRNGGLYAKLGWRQLEQVQYAGNKVSVMVRTIEPPS